LRRRLLSLGLGVFLLLSLSAAPAMVSADVPHTTIIAMSNTAFVPQVTVINVGDTVTWTNYDAVPHTVTSTTDSYNVSSPMLQRGDKFSFTFTKAGVFTYYCEVHPFMVGTIYVGVDPPPSDAVLNPNSAPGLTLSMNKASDGGVSLTASLNGVLESQAAGVPVSFFARYQDNSSTYWSKLDTLSTGSNGTARLTLPRGAATAFQAFAPPVGNLTGEYSNIVEFGAPASAVGTSTSYLPVIILAAAACLSLSAFLLLRRSRS
jgi:plastocyanin